MISHIKEVIGISLSGNDVESIFSPDEEITPEIVRAIHPPSDSSDYSNWTNQEDEAVELYKLSSINTVLPVPNLKVQVFPPKYSKPIKLATFFDIEASYMIMNPDVLPTEY